MVGCARFGVDVSTNPRLQPVDRRVARLVSIVEMDASASVKDRERVGLDVFAHVAEFLFGVFQGW